MKERIHDLYCLVPNPRRQVYCVGDRVFGVSLVVRVLVSGKALSL